jgi:triosephosphate isomerase
MQHQLFLVGNWKMNPETEKQAIALAVAYKSLEVPKFIQLACAVPLPFVQPVSKALVFKIFIQKNQVHIPEKFRFQ